VDGASLKFALDSNVFGDVLQNRGQVAQRLRQVPRADLYVPSVVVYELRYGMAKHAIGERRREALEKLLALCQVLPLDAQAAQSAAQMRVALEALGTPIGEKDLLIAATAQMHGCTLVSRNTREFARIADLALQDWF
jgi:tRNA(fMet)-specific endonuclease VapC